MKRRTIGVALAVVMGLAPAISAQDSPPTQASQTNEIRAMIGKGELDEAIAKIEELAKVDSSSAMTAALRTQIAMSLIQKDRKPEAVDQINKAIDYQLANLDNPSVARSISGSLSVATSALQRAGEVKRAEEVSEKVLKAIDDKLKGSKISPLHQAYGMLIRSKASRLGATGNGADAKALLEENAVRAEKVLEANPGEPLAVAYAIDALSGLFMTLEGVAANEHLNYIEKLAFGKFTAKPDATILTSYMNVLGSFASRMSRDFPEEVGVAVKNYREFLTAGKELLPDSDRQIDAMLKGLDSLDSRIASARKLVEMIGKPAPRFDIMQIVNGKPFTQDELKGKVVLLDFWAVWCGPCIATFPHLQHLNEEYGSKGLQIVGVTRQYNYSWDEETKKAKGVPKGETVALEDEIIMLEKFLASYELKHPTIVTPLESTMNKEFAVTGIPHVALLDKSGTVRLIKVGSGEKNAKDIEEMVKTLLAE